MQKIFYLYLFNLESCFYFLSKYSFIVLWSRNVRPFYKFFYPNLLYIFYCYYFNKIYILLLEMFIIVSRMLLYIAKNKELFANFIVIFYKRYGILLSYDSKVSDLF